MTVEELKRLIKQGRGEAILHLREVGGDAHLDIVLHAVTHDLAFDSQCNSYDDYAFSLFLTLAQPAAHIPYLQDALFRRKNSHDRYQIRSVLGNLHRRGIPGAREALLRDFRRWRLKEEHQCSVTEYLGLEGLALFVQHWRKFSELNLSIALSTACDELGEDVCRDFLKRSASRSSNARHVLSIIDRPDPAWSREPEPTVAQVLKSLRSNRLVSIVGFLKHAGPAQLAEAAQIGLDYRGTERWAGRRIFSRKQWPFDVTSLLLTAINEPDKQRKDHLFGLLRGTRHPSLRSWALQNLESEPFASDVLGRNAEKQDLPLMFEYLQTLKRKPDEYHWVELDLRQHIRSLSRSMLKEMIASGWCFLCRSQPVEELDRRRALPDDLLPALAEDADKYTREIATRRLQRRRSIAAKP